MEMEDNMQDLIRIGTRKSRLALVQTNIVRQKIEEAFPGILWRKRRFYPGTGGGIAG